MGNLLTSPFSPGHQPGILTNVAAAAGEIGEVITAQRLRASALSLTTVTIANIASISLTAGDWDVFGVGAFNGSSAAVNFIAAISTVSATSPGLDSGQLFYAPAQNISVVDFVQSLPTVALRLNATTTVYLIGYADFAAGTVSAYGTLTARRMR